MGNLGATLERCAFPCKKREVWEWGHDLRECLVGRGRENSVLW